MLRLPLMPQIPELISALSELQNRSVCIIGDVMLDRYISGHVDRISPEAPIPILSQTNSQNVPGGASNVARNLVHIGCQVHLHGAIGQDDAAEALCHNLSALPQLNFEPVICADRPTTLKTRFMSSGQQILRLDHEEKTPISPTQQKDLLTQLNRSDAHYDIIILSDYAKGMLPPSLCQDIILTAQKTDTKVIIDPKASDLSAYRGAYAITPNLKELQAILSRPLSALDDIATAASELAQDYDIQHIIVTLGGRGMLVACASDEAVHIPGHPCTVYDVSGAGDTVVALLSACLAGDIPLHQALQTANLAASLVVSKLGTASLCPGELILAAQPELPTLDITSLLAQISAWRDNGQTIGFTNGCFDLLHPGHMHILKQAAQATDRLIIGLNSDSSVAGLKGPDRPLHSEQNRAAILNALEWVDAVILFDEDTPKALIEAISPDVLTKGGDYRAEDIIGYDHVTGYGGHVHIIDTHSLYSTTSFNEMAAI